MEPLNLISMSQISVKMRKPCSKQGSFREGQGVQKKMLSEMLSEKLFSHLASPYSSALNNSESDSTLFSEIFSDKFGDLARPLGTGH